MTLRLAALAAILAAGCATPTTGVVPAGDGLASVTHQGGGMWISTDVLRTAATQEADAYCQKTGKSAKVVRVKEVSAGPLGRWPEADVLFRCE